MGHIIADLKETFRRGNIFIQLIYINVGIFVIGTLINVFLRLFEVSTPDIFGIFALPASFIGFIHQPWSLFTYMFMHAGILHILFNMLWLYWFGSLFLYFFSAKHLRGLYVLGGICGGLLYMVAYNVFPLFSSQVAGATLVGASASVLAIVAATAYREPNYRVQLFLFGAIRLKYLALVVIGIDVLSITSSNAGGHIAHLGGAFSGWLFILGVRRNKDFVSGFLGFFERIPRFFSGKKKMRVKYKKPVSQMNDREYNQYKKRQNDRINEILDKISKSGYESLSREEKEILFRSGRN